MTGRHIEKDSRLIRYLLGELTSEEQASLEDAYFSDDALYEELDAAETELIDAYVCGHMSHDLRRRFEERYLASPRQRERVDIARRLLREAQLASPEASRARGRWWRTILPGLVFPQPSPALVAALVFLSVVMIIGWWINHAGRPEFDQARQEQRTIPAKQAAPAQPQRIRKPSEPATAEAENDVIALTLRPGLIRSDESGTAVRVPRSAKTVRITIEYEGGIYQNYRVVIRTPEGREVWRAFASKPTKSDSRTVVASFPASALTQGDYILTLSGSATGGAQEDLGDYSFRVVKR